MKTLEKAINVCKDEHVRSRCVFGKHRTSDTLLNLSCRGQSELNRIVAEMGAIVGDDHVQILIHASRWFKELAHVRPCIFDVGQIAS